MTDGKVSGQTGSLTALPIIETQAGDVSAFVPTNVISITDGQIYLDTDMFNANKRPAINAGLSVSRVGGAAQTPIIKKLGGSVRLALAQFHELEAFSQFASDLDEATKQQLERGKRITEILKQQQYSPYSVSETACVLYMVSQGHVDDIPSDKIVAFEESFIKYLNSKHKKWLEKLNNDPKLNDNFKSNFDKAIVAFKKIFVE